MRLSRRGNFKAGTDGAVGDILEKKLAFRTEWRCVLDPSDEQMEGALRWGKSAGQDAADSSCLCGGPLQ